MKGAIVIIITFLALMTLSIAIFTEPVTYRGVVLEHHVGNDRSGNFHYTTLARYEDGHVRTNESFEQYLVPVGGTVYHRTRKIK